VPLGGRRQWSGAVVPMRHISRGAGWNRCPSSQSYIQSKCDHEVRLKYVAQPQAHLRLRFTEPPTAAPPNTTHRASGDGGRPKPTPRAEPDARTLLTVLRETDAPDGCPRPRLKQTQTTLLSTNRLRNPPSASPRAPPAPRRAQTSAPVQRNHRPGTWTCVALVVGSHIASQVSPMTEAPHTVACRRLAN